MAAKTMRIHVLSDLHQEFGEIDVPNLDCDCVVLAGDVSTKEHGLEWIRRRFHSVPVIYICGNHEFYGEKLPRLSEKLREKARGSNVYFLENDSVAINGIHFYGCTLWTDMALIGSWQEGTVEAGGQMNDYKRIRNSNRGFKRLTPTDTRMVHLASLRKMEEFFAQCGSQTSVVVTHHAPSILSLPEERRTQHISCAYASNLDEFVLKHQPHLWIHGHIHHSSDYRIGATRVISNRRAYPDGPNQTFLPNLVVEVPASISGA
jgi:hypothetical protein